MGAWGNGPFDNDAAVDFYLELIDEGDLTLIEDELDVSISEDELFDYSDMQVIRAAIEVLLGLIDPAAFEKRAAAGGVHKDPLSDGLAAISEQADGDQLQFSIPDDLVAWVKRRAPFRNAALLTRADRILEAAAQKGVAFYEGYLTREEQVAAWQIYLDDVKGRVKAVVMTLNEK